MNTFDFFNDNFGRLLVQQGNDPFDNAWRALKSEHLMATGKTARLVGGWAIIRERQPRMQQKLAADGIEYDDRTRFEAFDSLLADWDEKPLMLLVFDKAPVPISNLFLTVDLRAVRICSPAGVITFDYTKEPTRRVATIL